MIKHNLTRLALVLAVICIALSSNSFGQAQPGMQDARKFDEFGDIQISDLKARLDNLAIQLQSEPGARGFIISYRSYRDLPGLSSRLLVPMKEYLINNRGIAADRIVTVDGGAASCLAHEFWIVPVGKAPAPRSDAYSRHFIDTESAWKFDEYYVPSVRDYMEGDESVGSSLEAFADALRKQPRALAYILAYGQYHVERRLDSPNAATKMLRDVRSKLVNEYRIAPSRIKLVNGGYRKLRQVELWVVPRGEHPPIATPNAFPKRRK